MKTFDFDDILIVPAVFSDIKSRSEVIIEDENGYLPLFAAPMDTVVCPKNYHFFKEHGIHPIIPRTSECPVPDTTLYWVAYSLEHFETVFCDTNLKYKSKNYVLIDVANGHMKRLYDAAKKAKELHKHNLVLMVGNVANPQTALEYANLGVDYIRLGIGAGAGCWVQGTKVLTEEGYKNIEDITTEDLVMTHTGEWKNVILTHELDYNEELIEINGDISTNDHMYYVIHKNDKEKITDENYKAYAFWLEAKNIQPDNHMILEME